MKGLKTNVLKTYVEKSGLETREKKKQKKKQNKKIGCLTDECEIMLERKQLHNENDFQYLGSVISKSGEKERYFSCYWKRLLHTSTPSVFLIVKIVFNHPEIVKSITRIAQKLQLFNLYCVRIILRIFLRDKIRNTILLTMAKTKAQIVVDRRIHFIYHIFIYLKNVMSEKLLTGYKSGKRPRRLKQPHVDAKGWIKWRQVVAHCCFATWGIR